MKRRKLWMPWVITIGIGCIITCSMMISSDIFALSNPMDVYAAASDAFFVPGIIMLSFGLLGFVSREGVFDMVGYGMRTLLVLFTPLRKPEKQEKYYEFKQRRQAIKDRPRSNVLFVSGAFFVIAAGICLALYALEGGL